MIVGIARTNEEKQDIMFFIMLLEAKNFVLKIAKGRENKTLIMVVKKAKARLIMQDFNSEKKEIAEKG